MTIILQDFVVERLNPSSRYPPPYKFLLVKIYIPAPTINKYSIITVINHLGEEKIRNVIFTLMNGVNHKTQPVNIRKTSCLGNKNELYAKFLRPFQGHVVELYMAFCSYQQ